MLRPLKAGVGQHTDRGRNHLEYPVGVGHTLVMAGASLAGGEPTDPAVGIGYHDGFARVPLLLPRLDLLCYNRKPMKMSGGAEMLSLLCSYTARGNRLSYLESLRSGCICLITSGLAVLEDRFRKRS